MIVTPRTQYTLRDLQKWFEESKSKKESLYIYPCNPTDARIFWTSATIETDDDIACLTQWLGGIPY